MKGKSTTTGHIDPRGKWKMQILKDNWPLANQVLLADLNGDGRLEGAIHK